MGWWAGDRTFFYGRPCFSVTNFSFFCFFPSSIAFISRTGNRQLKHNLVEEKDYNWTAFFSARERIGPNSDNE